MERGDRCHCGKLSDGSDHCNECGCEHHERTCIHVAPIEKLKLLRNGVQFTHAEREVLDWAIEELDNSAFTG